MKTIIFDTETTGLPEKGKSLEFRPYIIEFGAIYLDDDGSIIRTVNQLLNPGNRIWDKDVNRFGDKLPPIITKITGINDHMLIDKPTFHEFSFFLSSFFTKADMLIAHNAAFDVMMLENELKRRSDHVQWPFPLPKEIICSMLEYTHQFGKWPKLDAIYAKIMGKPLAQTHRALDDVMALHEILIKDNFFEKIGEKS